MGAAITIGSQRHDPGTMGGGDRTEEVVMVWEQDGWPEMRAARVKAGVTLGALAVRCGKSPQFINDVEKGARFGGPTAHCIARELGMPVVEADLHHYRFERMPVDLIFGDEEHVRECLARFREMVRS
jgi:hypothetical protein